MHPLVLLGLDALTAVLAPPRCAACGAGVPLRTAFCPVCVASVERASSSAGAPFVYGGAMAHAITRFKYGPRPDLAHPLGRLLAAHAAREGLSADAVVPVPLHPQRLASRGFNQAALLAAHVARVLDVRHEPLALRRTRDTGAQAELDRAARLRNVVGAFEVRRPAAVAGRRVLLVDDVRTTGATLAACAAAVEAAGAARALSLVLAIAP